jgi:hypothetical protein
VTYNDRLDGMGKQRAPRDERTYSHEGAYRPRAR